MRIFYKMLLRLLQYPLPLFYLALPFPQPPSSPLPTLNAVKYNICYDLSCSLFSIVNFPNAVCSSTTGDNGTCITAPECIARSGQVGRGDQNMMKVMRGAELYRICRSGKHVW